MCPARTNYIGAILDNQSNARSLSLDMIIMIRQDDEKLWSDSLRKLVLECGITMWKYE